MSFPSSRSLGRLAPAALLAAIAAAGFAPALAAHAPAPIHFADLSALDLKSALPAPPAPDSVAGQADLETVLSVQAHRTPDEVQWAKLIDNYDLWTIFGHGGLLGPHFDAAHWPVLARAYKALKRDTTPEYKAAKALFDRPRPFSEDSRVRPCVDRPPDASYPSGHSFNAHIAAEFLAQIMPERRAALFQRAREVAWGRIVGGVHFPTDLEAGRLLAKDVMELELQNPAFQAAIAACREEAARELPEAAASTAR